MKYDSEKDFVDELKYTLINLGYSVWTEVVPDECLKWEKPHRVDLVFWHPIIGYIGVEAKNIRTLRQGSIFADAIKQIIRYREYTYRGQKINKWCVSVPQHVCDLSGYEEEKVLRELNHFISNFLRSMYGISILDGLIIDAYTLNRIDILKNDNHNLSPPVQLCEYDADYWSVDKDIFCEQCGASLDVEDEVCPYCNKKKEIYYGENN
jgi:hypothetical protein